MRSLLKREKLKQVQLDVPEVIQFLTRVTDQFGIEIPYTGQSIAELAKELSQLVQRGRVHE